MEKALYNDIQLFQDMQSGHRKAFDLIFRKYYPILCTYAHRYIAQEDAEEVVQDILLWIWENRQKLTIDYSLKRYLFRMVHHRCLNRIVQNEAKLKADTAYYEKTLDILHETDVTQSTNWANTSGKPSTSCPNHTGRPSSCTASSN